MFTNHTSFTEYASLVLEAYKKMRESRSLPGNLQQPTAASLRNECFIALSERYQARDERLLRDFFGPRPDYEAYLQCIRNTDSADKFRQVLKWIDGKVSDPHARYVEMLALLIDFNPRPYSLGYDYKQNLIKSELSGNLSTAKTEEKTDLVSSAENEDSATKNHFSANEHNQKTADTQSIKYYPWVAKVKNIQQYAGIVLLLGITSVLVGYKHFFDNENCMYWLDDHYESIACNEQIPNTQTLAADPYKLDFFRRINEIDTLKEDCIGKIWYSKIDNKIEFFTLGGMHPEHSEKALKPVTAYIYNKYISDSIKNQDQVLRK